MGEEDSKPVYKRPIQVSSSKSVKDSKDENVSFMGSDSIESAVSRTWLWG